MHNNGHSHQGWEEANPLLAHLGKVEKQRHSPVPLENESQLGTSAQLHPIAEHLGHWQQEGKGSLREGDQKSAVNDRAIHLSREIHSPDWTIG